MGNCNGDEANSIVDVSLYLKGQKLVPQEITQILGVDPSHTHLDQELVDPGSEDSARYHGAMWSTRVEATSASASEVLTALLNRLEKNDKLVSSVLPNVDDAFIDVYVSNSVPSDALSRCIDFTLTPSVLARVAKLGIAVCFSVSNVSEEAAVSPR